jgi:hypothetical protein
MTLNFIKGQQVMLAKNSKFIGFVIFSHWEKKHANGKYWFDIDGNKYSINDLA